MTSRAENSRFSRRHLIRSGAAAAILAASGMSATAQPRRGGTLRIAAPPGEILERLVAPGSVFDCLTVLDANGALRGELASDWEARDRGHVWIVTLAPGSRCHDGRSVTPELVLRVLRPMIGRPGPLSDVTAMRKHGARRVRVVLAAPDAQFPMRLTDPALAIGTSRDDGSGTGFYKVVERLPGPRLRLERVAAHPRGDLAGWFERVEILGLDCSVDRCGALLAGRVDLAFELGPEAPHAIARSRHLALSSAEISCADGPRRIRIGHSLRLTGLDQGNCLRIAEHGRFL